MQINRRDFLKSSTLGGLALLTGCPLPYEENLDKINIQHNIPYRSQEKINQETILEKINEVNLDELNQVSEILKSFDEIYSTGISKIIDEKINASNEKGFFESSLPLLDTYNKNDGNIQKPGVMLIHGGAWIMGDKDEFRDYAIDLAKKDFFVSSINYRLAPLGVWPNNFEDCTHALNWMQTNEESFANPNNIGVSGISAGGHLTAEMLVRNETNYKIKCAAPLFPPTNIFSMAGHEDPQEGSEIIKYLKSNGVYRIVAQVLEEIILGESYWGDKERFQYLVQEFSPQEVILKNDRHNYAPSLTAVGNKDPLVHLSQGYDFHNLLNARGGNSRILELNEGHGFELGSESYGWKQVTNFLEENLKN